MVVGRWTGCRPCPEWWVANVAWLEANGDRQRRVAETRSLVTETGGGLLAPESPTRDGLLSARLVDPSLVTDRAHVDSAPIRNGMSLVD